MPSTAEAAAETYRGEVIGQGALGEAVGGGPLPTVRFILLSAARQLTQAAHATYMYMHEFRRVQTQERDVSDTSPESTPTPAHRPHPRAAFC